MDAQQSPSFVVKSGNHTVELSRVAARDGGVLWFGSASEPGDDQPQYLQQAGEYVSRRHARIEMSRNDYYLVDSSANGTYVQMEDEQVCYVHRNRLRLWGSGWISLGEPMHAGAPLQFRQVQ